MFSKPTIGERLALLRQQEELSQASLAESLGMTTEHLDGLENNTCPASLDTVIRFADFFHVNTDYLLGLTDRPQIGDGAAD